MKKITLLTSLIFLSNLILKAQIGVFGVDANGNTTEKCSDAGWDKSDCSLTKIKVGQIIPDKKEVNCEGVAKTLYNTLSDGKPLMIIVEAWGCGPCWDSAPEKSDFIMANKSKINFWIPICEYFGNDAECKTDNKNDRRSIEGWQNNFIGFKESFMFLDNDRTYNLDGIPAQPGVGVIDGKTKKLVYSGYSFQKAEEIALELAENITSTIKSEQLSYTISPNPANDEITINTLKNDNNYQIISLTGKILEENQFSGTSFKINLKNLDKGTYILKVNSKAQQLVIQ
jgi:hypothetical protein